MVVRWRDLQEFADAERAVIFGRREMFKDVLQFEIRQR